MPVTKLLSFEARNNAASAISSDLPIRPIGTAATKLDLSCSTPSGVDAWSSMIGVSTGPGLKLLTRILRCFNSIAQLRARARTAALLYQVKFRHCARLTTSDARRVLVDGGVSTRLLFGAILSCTAGTPTELVSLSFESEGDVSKRGVACGRRQEREHSTQEDEAAERANKDSHGSTFDSRS
jgi:hypothetical protein